MAKKKEKKLAKKVVEKKRPPKEDKKKSLPEKKKKSDSPEEDIEEISEKEIENFQIEGIDMEKLKTTVLDRVAKRGDDGIFQS